MVVFPLKLEKLVDPNQLPSCLIHSRCVYADEIQIAFDFRFFISSHLSEEAISGSPSLSFGHHTFWRDIFASIKLKWCAELLIHGVYIMLKLGVIKFLYFDVRCSSSVFMLLIVSGLEKPHFLHIFQYGIFLVERVDNDVIIDILIFVILLNPVLPKS